MEMQPARSKMTWTFETTLIAWIELSFMWTYCVKFEANIWKCSQMTKAKETIKGYPRNHHCYSSNRE